jgi:hypothetical protein
MYDGERAIAAIFDDREGALWALALLHEQSFPEPWMATTRPATGDASQNDVDESSDGVLGAIGRFFTGEGNSLRRSLEDHGIDPERARVIDETLAPLEAVVTVFVDDRRTVAAEILARAGGRSVPNEVQNAPSEPSALRTDRAVRSLVPVDTTFRPPAIDEAVFVERRNLVPIAKPDRTNS